MVKTSKDIENKILDLYLNQKLSTTDVGLKFNLSSTAISNILKRNGFKRRNLSESKKGKLRGTLLPIDEIIKLYKEGLTSRKIADITQCTHRSVLNILHSNKINIRPAGHFNYINPLQEEIVKLYKEGKSINQVRKLTNMSYSGIGRILRNLSIVRTENKNKGMIGIQQSKETKEKVRTTRKKRKENGLYDHIYLKKTGYTYEEFQKTLPEFKKYCKKVRCETNKQPLSELKNYEKRGGAKNKNAYHLDHKYSITSGFRNNVCPKIIGNICNLEMIPWKENLTKSLNCSISLENLLKEYNSK